MEIAWYWLALGRVTEARALADELADELPADADQWFPASTVICLAARLARQAHDSSRHAQLIARIATTPAYVLWAESGLVDEHLSRLRAVIKRHRIPGPIDEVCNELTHPLSLVVYSAETLASGLFGEREWLSLDAAVSDGVQLLGDHLAGRVEFPSRLEVTPVPEHSGILIIKTQAIPADRFALWWIDLATGDSGRVPGARSATEIITIRDSSAAWLFHVRNEELGGSVLVERTRAPLESSFVADLHVRDVRGISSDGCYAVMTDPDDGSLITATLDRTGSTPRGNLGVILQPWDAVLAVLADGSAVISISDNETVLVQHVKIGAPPSPLLRVVATDVFVADDASIVVTISGDYDGERELAVHRPSTGAPARTVALGRGGLLSARFAPGNRHFVLAMSLDDDGARMIAIDLESVTLIELAVAAGPFTLSPDGQFVVIWDHTLLIMPIEGGTAYDTKIEGCPYAWLR